MNLHLQSYGGSKQPLASLSLLSWTGILLSAALAAGCGGSTEATAPKPAPDAVTPAVEHAAAKTTPKAQPAAKAGAAKASSEGTPTSKQTLAVTQPKPANVVPPAKLLITLEALSLRRDLWPAKVTLKQPVKISASETLAAGREFGMHEMLGPDVAIDTGTELIQITGSDTDILERASATMVSLTAEQLALTEHDLPSRQDLWPLEVKLKNTMQFSSGTQVSAGTSVILRAFNGNSTSVYDRTLKDHFMCEVPETDIMQRARERMLLPEAERKPFFMRSLAAAVDPAANSTLDSSKFVLVYQGRKECPRCAAFAPKLKEFYARIKPDHPDFEAVYLGLDTDPSVTREHAKQAGYPGRVLIFDKRMEAGDLGALGGTLLPLVFLLDAQGKVLARNQGEGGSPSATDVLAMAEAKIKAAN